MQPIPGIWYQDHESVVRKVIGLTGEPTTNILLNGHTTKGFLLCPEISKFLYTHLRSFFFSKRKYHRDP